MKRSYSIITGCIIITGLLLITNDSCKKEPHGHCVVKCICNNCNPTGYTVTGADTEKACIEDWKRNNAAGAAANCPCSCTWEFTPN